MIDILRDLFRWKLSPLFILTAIKLKWGNPCGTLIYGARRKPLGITRGKR